MHNSTRFVGAIAAAGLAAAAAGVSASTASSALPSGGVSGYAVSTATGANVTSIVHTPKTGDTSRLASVAFITDTDITGTVAQLTLKNAGSIVGVSYPCTFTVFATTSTITCPTADNPLLSAFDETGLTVS